MKRKVLILGLIAMTAALPACAELTVEDATSRDYMYNHGYSNAFINATQKTKAQTNGEALAEPVEKESYNRPFTKYVRRFFMYIDPAYDDHSFMNDHQIHTSPSIDDL